MIRFTIHKIHYVSSVTINSNCVCLIIGLYHAYLGKFGWIWDIADYSKALNNKYNRYNKCTNTRENVIKEKKLRKIWNYRSQTFLIAMQSSLRTSIFIKMTILWSCINRLDLLFTCLYWSWLCVLLIKILYKSFNNRVK